MTADEPMACDSFTFYSASEADTERLAEALAACATPNLLVTLEGPLGAGKTRLVQALGRALGVPAGQVQSPTFVLVRQYQGRMPLYHLDAYRLVDDDEFLALGPEECFDGGGSTCLEWASRVERCLPADRLEIAIKVTSPLTRRLVCQARGDEPRRILSALARCLAEPSPGNGTS
jgi:tRNA threonylcarbamoyladenosine biosynthesis protein TsaE